MLIVLAIAAVAGCGLFVWRKWRRLDRLVTQLTPDDGSWIG